MNTDQDPDYNPNKCKQGKRKIPDYFGVGQKRNVKLKKVEV